MQPGEKPLDVAKVRAEAESWLKTYASDPQPTPSMAWPWLNGRCHPSIVLALCERIDALEAELSDSHMAYGHLVEQRIAEQGLAVNGRVDGGRGGA